jgi:hypothetical protein
MPSSPVDWQVLSAIKAAIERADGTGSYANDLSSRVVYGVYPIPNPPLSTLPCIAVAALRTDQVEGDDLQGRTLDAEVLIQVWSGALQDPASRIQALLEVVSDVRQGLEAARRDTGTILQNDVFDWSITTDYQHVGEVGTDPQPLAAGLRVLWKAALRLSETE